MKWDWHMNGRLRMITTKAAAATMATLLFASQAPGFAGNAAAAQGEQVAEAETGEYEQLDITSDNVPEGAKISSRQAVENILKLFPVLKKAKISSANFDSPNSYPPPNYKAWEIGFQFTQGSHTMGFGATVHAGTGEVLNVHLPSDFLDKQVPATEAKLTREEAEKSALALLNQAVPGLQANEYASLGDMYSIWDQQALFGRTEYRYGYRLKHDGILSEAERIYINVDDRGQISSYSRTTTSAKYPSSKPGASEEKARKVFENQLDVELAYIAKDYPTSKQGVEYYLGYTPKSHSVTPIHADTLERINTLTGKSDDKNVIQQDIKLEGDTASFVPVKGSRLNGQQAVNRVTASFDIPKGYKLKHSQLGKGYYGSPNHQVWNLSWSDQSANPSYMFMQDISAQVDAVTGQIYSYSMMQRMGPEIEKKKSEENSGKPLTRKLAEQMAINKILTLIPDAREQFRLTNVMEAEDARTFVFQRYMNDIPVMGDTAQIQVMNNGAINQFFTSINATQEQLPTNIKPAISYTEAKATYLKEFKLDLVYSRYGGVYSQSSGKASPEGIHLAYMPARGQDLFNAPYEALDANTGEWKGLYGNTNQTSQVAASDISGHVAEAALRRMTQHKVLLADEQGRVFPDRVITRGDWFNYLARAINPNMDLYYGGDRSEKLYADVTPDSPYYKAVQVLLDQRWITGADSEKKLNPQEEMTREELAVLLVRILRYEKLAGFYTLPSDLPNIADASAITSKGAVSLSLKLGLLPSIEGRFLPARKVTVAEASQVLERLAQLQDKTDTFTSGSRLY